MMNLKEKYSCQYNKLCAYAENNYYIKTSHLNALYYVVNTHTHKHRGPQLNRSKWSAFFRRKAFDSIYMEPT